MSKPLTMITQVETHPVLPINLVKKVIGLFTYNSLSSYVKFPQLDHTNRFVLINIKNTVMNTRKYLCTWFIDSRMLKSGGTPPAEGPLSTGSLSFPKHSKYHPASSLLPGWKRQTYKVLFLHFWQLLLYYKMYGYNK